MVLINCDMGESFGIYSAGNDEEIMPLIELQMLPVVFMLLIQITLEKLWNWQKKIT